MKPAILVTLEYPPQIGGIAEYLRHFIEQFPRGAVHVLAPPAHDTHELDMASEAPIYRKPLMSRFLWPHSLPALYWMNWLRRKEKAGLLIISHLLPMGLMALVLHRLTGMKYVVIIHGMDAALAIEAGSRRRKAAEMILKNAEMVIANSNYTAQFAESFGVTKDKITIVRPSPSLPLDTVATPEMTAKTREKYGLGSDFTVLTVGRLVTRKGHATCIEAVADLVKRGVAVKYLIVGEGPARAALEQKAQDLGVANQVKFTGAVAKEELSSIYGACDVFVMVPKSTGADVEGFGIVYLEANLLGKPVIGSRSGGVIDAVIDGYNGLLVNPDDTAALTAALQSLVNDSALREKLGRQGRTRVLDEFGWHRQVAPLLGAFATYLKENGKQRI